MTIPVSFTTSSAPSFTCGTSTLTDIDGNTYNTVQIGNQCWMKENLRTTKYANGTSISQGNNTSTTTAYWYYPNNNSSNMSTYGLLYNWKAVMGSSSSSNANPSGVQGVCPTGWHVPSRDEWIQLINYVRSQRSYVCDSTDNVARFSDTDVADEFKKAQRIYLPLFAPVKEYERLIESKFNVCAEIPRGMFGIENQIKLRLSELKKIGVRAVLASNIGAVNLANKMGFEVHGGFGLNITNTESLIAYEKMGLKSAELSFELTKNQIKEIGGNIERGIIAAGYLPLMLLRACPNLNSSVKCSTCTGNTKMQDRMGENFILKCDGNCTEVLNSVYLSLCNEIDIFCGLDFFTLRLTVENSVEKVENIRSFSSKHHIFSKITRGLYLRGVK